MAARSRSVGRYDLVVEVAKSQLGPLWAATVPGPAALEPRLVRCVAAGAGASVRDVDTLADVGRWSGGFLAEQALSTLEVVSAGRALALVTSYVPGETLRSLLRFANIKREPIATRVALALTLDVCRALAAAEARALETARGPEFLWGGLLPDSIWVGTDGTARVLDLGVASVWRTVSNEAQHPEVAAYSAPEQLEPGEVPASADVFTLGILLWEMLSGGKRLFAAASQRAVIEKLKKLAAPPPDPPGAAVDTDTRTLLQGMLEPDPRARVSSVRELRQTLEAMGNAVASPRELAEFVTRIAASPLESRERTLGRALQRGPDPSARRPASDPPPRPTAAPAAPNVRAEPQALGTAKPLPLPAQAKLGGRFAAIEGRALPPPPPARALEDIDARVNEDEETGSVRAEDILAALAVEDLEPETHTAERVAVSASEHEHDVAEPAAAQAPISSGRRAPLTAVVVPSVVAGPDATFTPVPSVLQTLRGPGVPPLESDALGLASAEWVAIGSEAAANAEPATAARLPGSASPDRPGLAPGKAWSAKLEQVVGVARGARKRVPSSLVAALGGTALLLLIAWVAAGGGEQPASEPPSTLQAAQRAEVDRQAAAKLQRTAEQQAPSPNAGSGSEEAPKPAATEDTRAEAGTDDPTSVPATRSGAATASLTVAAVAAAPRAAASRPARRTSAAARATAPATKKKRIRATRKFIPSGI